MELPKHALPSVTTLLRQTNFTFRTRFWDIASVCLVLFLSSTLQDIASAVNIQTLFIVVTVVNLLISLLSVLAFILALSNPPSSINSPTSLYDRAIGLAIPFLWVIVIVVLVLIGGAVLFILPALAVTIILNFASSIVIVARVLFLVPILILSIFLNFTSYFLAVDNRRGLDALVASWHAVEGRWWQVAWRTLFFGALVFILSLIINLFIFLLSSPVTAASIASYQPSLSGSIVADAWSSFIIIPLSIIYFYHLFVHLKATRPAEPDETEKGSIKNWIMTFVILGIVTSVLGLIFATLVITKYLPGLLRTAPMTASVIYAPFLH